MTESLASHRHFELESDLAAAVAAIRADTESGPVSLARQGVAVVLQMTAKEYYERPLHIVLETLGLGRALLEARPDSLPLAHLASEMASPLPQFYGRDDGGRMRADLRARAEEWLARLESRAEQLVEQVASLLPERGSVATPARESSTFLAAVRKAVAASKRLQVLLWPVEAAPGQQLMDSLRGLGVRASWLEGAADGGAPPLREAGLVLASACAVDGDGVWADSGTGRLMAAARQGAPCYAVAGPEKFVPSNYPFPTTSPDRCLEAVPLSAWTGLLVGDAILTAEEVRAALLTLRLESTLL